jgi:hypothetical protein
MDALAEAVAARPYDRHDRRQERSFDSSISNTSSQHRDRVVSSAPTAVSTIPSIALRQVLAERDAQCQVGAAGCDIRAVKIIKVRCDDGRKRSKEVCDTCATAVASKTESER